jgi:Ca2+/Na+ antiporter
MKTVLVRPISDAWMAVTFAVTFDTSLSFTMLLLNRLTLLALALATILATVCTADTADEPAITHKVYFDMKQGDKDLGRSKFTFLVLLFILTMDIKL